MSSGTPTPPFFGPPPPNEKEDKATRKRRIDKELAEIQQLFYNANAKIESFKQGIEGVANLAEAAYKGSEQAVWHTSTEATPLGRASVQQEFLWEKAMHRHTDKIHAQTFSNFQLLDSPIYKTIFFAVT